MKSDNPRKSLLPLDNSKDQVDDSLKLKNSTEITDTDLDTSSFSLRQCSMQDVNITAMNKHGPPSGTIIVLTGQIPDFSNEFVNTTLNKLGDFKYESEKETFKDSIYLPPIQFQSDQSIYIGQWKNGRKHGRGRLLKTDSSRYDGYFEEDKANGKGRLIYKDGDCYVGEWKDSKCHGQGKYVKYNGEMYEGGWKEDFRHGQAIISWVDGTVYEGEYVEGQMTSKGKLTFAEGDYYEGDFVNNNFEGYGVYVWSNGRKYSGYWKAGNKHGKGESIWPDRRKFVGDYIDDKKIKGEVTYADGSRYIGQLHNGLMHGEGVFIDAEGIETKGKWLKGTLYMETEKKVMFEDSPTKIPDRDNVKLVDKPKPARRKSFWSKDETKKIEIPQKVNFTQSSEKRGSIKLAPTNNPVKGISNA